MHPVYELVELGKAVVVALKRDSAEGLVGEIIDLLYHLAKWNFALDLLEFFAIETFTLGVHGRGRAKSLVSYDVGFEIPPEVDGRVDLDVSDDTTENLCMLVAGLLKVLHEFDVLWINSAIGVKIIVTDAIIINESPVLTEMLSSWLPIVRETQRSRGRIESCHLKRFKCTFLYHSVAKLMNYLFMDDHNSHAERESQDTKDIILLFQIF